MLRWSCADCPMLPDKPVYSSAILRRIWIRILTILSFSPHRPEELVLTLAAKAKTKDGPLSEKLSPMVACDLHR